MQHFCVIGFPVEHSLSPQIQNAAFRDLKIDADFEKIAVAPEKLGDFMKHFQEWYSGCNVTIPHKESVMEFLDEIDEDARRIGAVNTIVNRDEKLIGFNTDVYGAMRSLREAMNISESVPDWLSGKNCAVLGAGGAARAVISGLCENGGSVSILNRNLEHAEKLAKEFSELSKGSSCHVGILSDFRAEDFDIIINTTPCGMYPNIQDVPVETSSFSQKQLVMDIVYYPRMTKFLREVSEKGAQIVTGDGMFLYQGARAFELWTGKQPPLDAMGSVLNKNLDEREKRLGL